MKVVVLGAVSPFALEILRNISQDIKHLFLQSKDVAGIQRSLLQLNLSCPVEIIDGDLEQPTQSYIDDFEQRLSRLGKVDVFICTLGTWLSHSPFVHTELESHFRQWQVNYFFPLAMLKIISRYTSKKFVCIHNNCDKAFSEKDSLNTLNHASLSFSNVLRTIALEL